MKKLRRSLPGKNKKAQRRLTERAATMLNHSMECCLCRTEFVRNQETVKTWQVTIREQRVRLTCPLCSNTVSKVLENRNED